MLAQVSPTGPDKPVVAVHSKRLEGRHHERNTRSPAQHGGKTTSDLTRTSSWHASLTLGFARRADDTLLAQRAHSGPLRVQKPLFPEGASVCHAVVLHPPGGIAGGDSLELRFAASEGAHALLTTPGAGKWYRAGGRRALQRVAIDVAKNAIVEWLPQPSIVFDGADADLATTVQIAQGGRYLGWDTLCLGRTASGERFTQGRVASLVRIECDGRLLFHERACIDGGSSWLGAAAGLRDKPVCAMLIAAGCAVQRDVIDAARQAPVPSGVDAGITHLSDVLIARCIAYRSEAATAWLVALWNILRPALIGRPATPLRLWNT